MPVIEYFAFIRLHFHPTGAYQTSGYYTGQRFPFVHQKWAHWECHPKNSFPPCLCFSARKQNQRIYFGTWPRCSPWYLQQDPTTFMCLEDLEAPQVEIRVRHLWAHSYLSLIGRYLHCHSSRFACLSGKCSWISAELLFILADTKIKYSFLTLNSQ